MPRHRVGNLDISYSVEFRPIRYPRIEMKTGSPVLILPKGYKEEKQLIEKHQTWIIEKSKEIQRAMREAENKKLNKERKLAELRKIVKNELDKCAYKLGKRPFKVQFKELNSRWASCGFNDCLTFNSLLRFLPENLIRYVVSHEYAHLFEKKHNERFWNLVKAECLDSEEKEKDLPIYWFLIKSDEKLSEKEVVVEQTKQLYEDWIGEDEVWGD